MIGEAPMHGEGTTMDEQEPLNAVAARYRSDGYEVLIHPSPSDVPTFLEGAELALLARKGDQVVAVQTSDRVDPDAEPIRVSGRVESAYARSLLEEAELLLTPETTRAALVLAWSAIEAV